NPLVHILRNSVDHGIESPDERVTKGKNRQGRLTIEAWVDEFFVHLLIKDDGGGIDPEKMKNVARKNALLSETEITGMSDKELVNLIFKPGFSSAEKVSDVSGRGVGMDVVLSSLKECNGTVDLDSTLDKGTTVNIKIPLTKTLVTKDALIVESAGQLFAIPSDEITTTLYVND
ncbi:MAG: chemotaxis protein CheA, partial [Deltaproteobacteria bacterium]|nr:chemotaxis protein CheA [Deltaproteobacteria bacterium]